MILCQYVKHLMFIFLHIKKWANILKYFLSQQIKYYPFSFELMLALKPECWFWPILGILDIPAPSSHLIMIWVLDIQFILMTVATPWNPVISIATFPAGFPRKSMEKLARNVASYWVMSPRPVQPPHASCTHMPATHTHIVPEPLHTSLAYIHTPSPNLVLHLTPTRVLPHLALTLALFLIQQQPLIYLPACLRTTWNLQPQSHFSWHDCGRKLARSCIALLYDRIA